MTENIALKRSWQELFSYNTVGNIDWNYYHQKPESHLNHGLSLKIFLLVDC